MEWNSVIIDLAVEDEARFQWPKVSGNTETLDVFRNKTAEDGQHLTPLRLLCSI